MSVTQTPCPQCQAPNHPTARWCVKCAHPLEAEAPPAAPAPMEFVFDDDEHPAATPPRQRPVLAYAGAAVAVLAVAVLAVAVLAVAVLAVAVLAVAGAAAWYLLGRPNAAPPAQQAPVVAAPVAAPRTPGIAESAPARPEPVEEIIESQRARPAATASAPDSATAAPSPAAAAAASAPPFTPVTVPRVADAASLPATGKPRTAAPADDAPWPPRASPVPSPGDSLARLRSALAQCAAMSNELSRASCLTRTRQNFCGDAWGRIPECPPGQ